MNRVVFGALLSHWRSKPLQLMTLVLGLALATALWSAVQAINAEARSAYAAAAQRIGVTTFPSLIHPEGPIDRETYVALRRGGWLVSPVLEGRMVTRSDTRLRVIGIELMTSPEGLVPVALDGSEPVGPAEFFQLPGVGFVSPGTMNRIEADEGLPILRAAVALSPGEMVTDIGIAEILLERTGEISRLLILPDQPRGRAPLEEVAPDLVRQDPQEAGDISRLTRSFHLNLTAFGLLSFGVGLFIVHGAVGLALEQRRGVIRTIRALGVPNSNLLRILAVELLVLALVAGAAGLVLGYLIAGALLPDVAATLGGLYGAAVPGTLGFEPEWAATGLALALFGTAVAGAGKLAQIARMPLLASARPRAWARADRRTQRLQALFGLGLLACGALAVWFGDGLIAGFALQAGLLLGSALLLPIILGSVLRLARRSAQRPLAQWFWADTEQQLPGMSLALMALLLALATSIGVGTMVSSFRTTFSGWLDQRLAPELYVTARNSEEASDLRDWLDRQPEVSAILPIWEIDLTIEGAPGTVYGIVDHATYRDNWPILEAMPQVWDRLALDRGVLVNEQLANREGLELGDPVTFGPGWTRIVLGIYSDYGNPLAQAIGSLPALERSFPDVPKLRFGLRVDPEAVEDVADRMRSELGLTPAQVIDQASIKGFSLRVFERTFTVTTALDVLTLTVAAFAILTALLTLSGLRLPQLAPVWALGLTRQRIARLELLRSLLLAGLTWVLAVPLGLLLAWTLLAIVNVEAFGWRLPMYVFPLQWIRLFGLALLAGAIAALWPSFRLSRMEPAQFLKVFANER